MQHQHFLLFKPFGYLSQFVNNEQHQKKKNKLLGELGSFPKGIMPIGRLDLESEGLLLLTTDGKTSYHILSNKVEKEYYAQLDGIITDQAIQLLQNGVTITVENAKYMTKPCKVCNVTPPNNLPERAKKIRNERHGPTTWISITLREGKFRQVRKMTAAVGFPTLRLVRMRIGNIKFDNQKAGEIKPLPANFIV